MKRPYMCGSLALALSTLTSAHVVARPDATGTPLWQQSVTGTAANSSDNAYSVAVDNQGNVVTAGSTGNSGTQSDFTVTKFDRDGIMLWQHNLNGTANSVDIAYSVAVDNQGNAVAAGYTTNTGTFADLTVAKFDRDGTLLWLQTLNGPKNGGDRALAVAVDNQGNVVTAGSVNLDFTVAKFDRDGLLLWQQNLNGRVNEWDQALSVAVDDQGNVLAAGFTKNRIDPIGQFNDVDFTVAKFDRDGILLWQQNLNGTSRLSVDIALAVAVDNQGNVVAAGNTDDRNTSLDFTVVKFDRDGTLVWLRTLNGPRNGADGADSVAVDNQGNVVASGQINNDFTVTEFDRDGILLWQQNLNGTAVNSPDGARSVAIDNQGNVVAAGYMTNRDTSNDVTVAKFGRDGILLWQHSLNGTANNSDIAYSVAVDDQGNAVAAGSTRNIGAGLSDFTVVKFDR